jgi:hypothetical protein
MKQAAGTLAGSLVVSLAVAACATAPLEPPATGQARSGEVGVEDLTATIAASARMMLADNENFLPPLPVPGNPPPVYPPELLAQAFHRRWCACESASMKQVRSPRPRRWCNCPIARRPMRLSNLSWWPRGTRLRAGVTTRPCVVPTSNPPSPITRPAWARARLRRRSASRTVSFSSSKMGAGPYA